ncbi:urease accessory protein UreD [Minwuia sp.]|uniref:urease accessory protein UreD n=1 Tax=Minwuia sp. TaxID=2493630 RepID=UPI003A8E50BB
MSAAPVQQAGSPGLPRSVGAVRLAFLGVGERAALADLHQRGCMKARLPKVYGDEPKTAVLINTAGGLTGGDRVSTEVTWGADADACISTQAAERIYRSTGDAAHITNTLNVAARASAEWLPQEMILFDQGRFLRRTAVHLQDDSRFLAVESMVLGRKAMGETVASGLIDDDWRIYRGTRLIYRDPFRLEGDLAAQIARPAVLDGAGAYATILAQVTDPKAMLDAVRDIAGTSGGASLMKGLVTGRLIAKDGDSLRDLIARIIPVLRELAFGRAGRLPRVFQI